MPLKHLTLSKKFYFYHQFYIMNCPCSTRMMEIQSQMSERALELLALPADRPCMVLDIGCGSGLSGECLDEQGHFWYEYSVEHHLEKLGNYWPTTFVCQSDAELQT